MAKTLAAGVACAGLLGRASAFIASPANGALRGAESSRTTTLATQTQATYQEPSQGGTMNVIMGGFAVAALGASLSVGKSSSRRAGKKNVVALRATDMQATAVKVGDTIPNIGLDDGFPPEKIMLGDYCKDKTVILVPGYLKKQKELKAKGVSDVFVYCVNDGAVMKGWADDQAIDGSIIKFLGDPRSELTQALGVVLDDPGPMSVLGNPRCKRFSMLIKDGVIKSINVAAYENDPAGDDNPEISMVDKMLEDLDAAA